ncbi:MAG TPA: DUF4249 domain-containing protein [Puia sp.]|nr:DUF4249 domain-containing protein [Puia sp.]
MRFANYSFIFLLLIFIDDLFCRQPYNPPALAGGVHYLVVDGTIISGNDSTIIYLSRTQNVSDSTYNFFSVAETGALVSVIGANGDSYDLNEQSAGKYATNQLNLNNSELYRLKIITSNGSQYLSDDMPVRITPPIDSVSWQSESEGVQIYVNTHDPQNNTRYYRWQYTETWEYHPADGSEYIYDPQDTTVIERDTNQMVSTCWQTNQSTDLLLGSSAKLSEDIIYEQPLILIPSESQKLSVEYSILVRQYALDASSFAFWQLLQQSTEQLGSLFDPQPSQLTGNIHNVSNPNEPVLGFISFATLQEQRIFIIRPPNWVYPIPIGCNLIRVGNTPDSLVLEYGLGGYAPVTGIIAPSSGAIVAYNSAVLSCVDCTLQGGTTTKPSFWP